MFKQKYSSQPSKARCAAAVALAGLTLSGCAGTRIVDFSVAAEIGGTDSTGQSWRARAEQITTQPRPDGVLTPFASLEYSDTRFSWVLGSGSLGGTLVNRMNAALCFRFDQAQVSSNFQIEPRPLRVSTVMDTREGKLKILGNTRPGQRTDFVPPKFCFDPGKSTYFFLAPSLDELFPSKQMFNARWAGNDATLAERGAGNWIKFIVPVEFDDKREVLDVKLTAVDSKGRVSYY